ncbi:MAG: hypothetical protein L0Z48_07115 [candidate division Zixibacteria bacterium]|nr:hypothetical protein [candidate division Zixibacteria bacterium]
MKNKWLVFIGLALGAGHARADDTGYKSPASTTGQFTNPGNVVSSNDSRAVEGTVNDTMACWDFSFNLPADAQSVNGLFIEAEGRLLESPPQGGGSTADLQIRLSWNGGSSWTSAKTEDYTEGEGEFYHGLGGAADLWGRSWTVTETNNTNFRISLKYSREDISQDQIEIDHVRAKIFYTPASTGLSPRRNRLFRD